MSKPAGSTSTFSLIFFIILLHIHLIAASPLDRRSLDLSRGATAGLGVGIAALGILILLVCILLILHFHQRKNITAQRPDHNSSSQTTAQQSGSNEKQTSTSDTKVSDQAIELGISRDTKEHNENTTQSMTTPQQQIQFPLPTRQKSLRDRLMGPLYLNHISNPAPHVRSNGSGTEMDRTDSEMDEEYARLRDGRNNARSMVDSYSSRRATRLMMYM